MLISLNLWERSKPLKPLRLIYSVKTTSILAQLDVCIAKNVDKSVGSHKMYRDMFFNEPTLYSSHFANAKENLIKITLRHAE